MKVIRGNVVQEYLAFEVVLYLQNITDKKDNISNIAFSLYSIQ